MCYCLSNKNTSNFSSLSNDFSINFFLIHQQVVMVVASRSISIWVVNQINWHWRCSIAHRFTWTPSDSKSLDRAWCASSHTHTHARSYALWFLSIAARLSGLTLPQMGPTTNEKCREEKKNEQIIGIFLFCWNCLDCCTGIDWESQPNSFHWFIAHPHAFAFWIWFLAYRAAVCCVCVCCVCLSLHCISHYYYCIVLLWICGCVLVVARRVLLPWE